MKKSNNKTKDSNPFKDKKPWDKLDKETDKKYRLFMIYKDLGLQRTLKRASEIYNEMSKDTASLSYLGQISGLMDWQRRVKAWDAYVNEDILDKQEELIRYMKARDSTVSKVFKEIIYENLLDVHLNTYEEDKNKKAYLISALAKAYETVSRIESKAYGEPSNKSEINKTIKYDMKSINKVITNPELSDQLSNIINDLDQKDKKIKEVELIPNKSKA